MTHNTTTPETSTDSKKKAITYALAGLGSVLILAGGITLATHNENTQQEETATETQTTQPTNTENSHSENQEQPNQPEHNQEQHNQENINMNPENNTQPHNQPPQNNAIENLPQEDQDILDTLIKNGDPNNTDYSDFITQAKITEHFGTPITVNGVEVTVANPRTANNQFTVDVKARNTTDQTQAFSGILFGAGPTPEQLDGPTVDSMASLNTEPLAPNQTLEGTLSFDTPEGKVFYLNPQTGESYVWN